MKKTGQNFWVFFIIQCVLYVFFRWRKNCSCLWVPQNWWPIAQTRKQLQNCTGRVNGGGFEERTMWAPIQWIDGSCKLQVRWGSFTRSWIETYQCEKPSGWMSHWNYICQLARKLKVGLEATKLPSNKCIPSETSFPSLSSQKLDTRIFSWHWVCLARKIKMRHSYIHLIQAWCLALFYLTMDGPPMH